MANLVSMREFARQMGVQLQAVQFGIKHGRIEIAETRQTGKRTRVFIDLITQGPAWKANVDPGRVTRPTRGEMAAQAGASGPAAAAGKPAAGAVVSNFQIARTAREALNAKITELEYRKKIGDLVELEAVKELFFNAAKTTQQSLLNIPARISAIVAAKTDEREIYDLLEKEISESLENLSNTNFDHFIK